MLGEWPASCKWKIVLIVLLALTLREGGFPNALLVAWVNIPVLLLRQVATSAVAI
jgi:hypothetical protein